MDILIDFLLAAIIGFVCIVLVMVGLYALLTRKVNIFRSSRPPSVPPFVSTEDLLNKYQLGPDHAIDDTCIENHKCLDVDTGRCLLPDEYLKNFRAQHKAFEQTHKMSDKEQEFLLHHIKKTEPEKVIPILKRHFPVLWGGLVNTRHLSQKQLFPYIKAGASFSSEDINGKPVIFEAVDYEWNGSYLNRDFFETLKKKSANIGALDFNGLNVLHAFLSQSLERKTAKTVLSDIQYLTEQGVPIQKASMDVFCRVWDSPFQMQQWSRQDKEEITKMFAEQEKATIVQAVHQIGEDVTIKETKKRRM